MRCCHSAHNLHFRGSPRVAGGSAAVWCDPNPPRSFARSRELQPPRPATGVSRAKCPRSVPESVPSPRRHPVGHFSGTNVTNVTGRPGDRTTEMNGGSTASYLARTPRVPLFMLIFIGLETKGLLDFQGRHGIASAVWWNLRPVIFGADFHNAEIICGLRWAKSRDSYRRIASESYRCDSNR